MDNTDYGRYRDSVSDWYTDYNNAYTDYRDSMGDYKWGTEFNYNAEQNQLDRDWEQMKWDYGVEQDALDRELAMMKWNYNVGRDGIEDSRYGNKTAFDQAMEMLAMGMRPNSSILKAAGIDESEVDKLLADMGDEGAPDDDKPTGKGTVAFMPSSLNLVPFSDTGLELPADDKEESSDEPSEEEVGKFWSSTNDLGIGMVSASLIKEIYNYGGVKKNADGTVSWANGWNKDNYKEKLEMARKMLPGFGVQR